MTISTLEVALPRAVAVMIDDCTLSIELSDGRTISAPLVWFPRLLHAQPAERQDWRLVGEGEGVHWPPIDEDIGVELMVAGRPSNESAQSLAKWLATRS
jgi:hypothetical protein